ncbi:hypothetical protein ACFLT9_04425 [Acidobacteriota bacterium]
MNRTDELLQEILEELKMLREDIAIGLEIDENKRRKFKETWTAQRLDAFIKKAKKEEKE